MNIDINSAWKYLEEQIKNCRKCDLCKTRNKVVIGSGPRENCKLVIIGEGPGEQEDLQGLPFVGKSGELLTKILAAASISRDTVYITNVVKCRPIDNRDPKMNEILACSDFLESQLLLLKPSIIITMGNPSTKWLLGTNQGITSIRGQWRNWRGIQLLPMCHPSYLIRCDDHGNRQPKQDAYRDILSVKAKLDSLNKSQNRS